MPRRNAAEALPVERPREEEERIEDLTHEAEEVAPPPVPEEALYKAGLKEAERLKRETDAAIKDELAKRDAARKARHEEDMALFEARKDLENLPDMTLEAELEDPKDRDEHYKKLERHFEANRAILEKRRKREAGEGEPSSFEGAGKPEKKRGLFARLKGLFGR